MQKNETDEEAKVGFGTREEEKRREDEDMGRKGRVVMKEGRKGIISILGSLRSREDKKNSENTKE